MQISKVVTLRQHWEEEEVLKMCNFLKFRLIKTVSVEKLTPKLTKRLSLLGLICEESSRESERILREWIHKDEEDRYIQPEFIPVIDITTEDEEPNVPLIQLD